MLQAIGQAESAEGDIFYRGARHPRSIINILNEKSDDRR